MKPDGTEDDEVIHDDKDVDNDNDDGDVKMNDDVFDDDDNYGYENFVENSYDVNNDDFHLSP